MSVRSTGSKLCSYRQQVQNRSDVFSKVSTENKRKKNNSHFSDPFYSLIHSRCTANSEACSILPMQPTNHRCFPSAAKAETPAPEVSGTSKSTLLASESNFTYCFFLSVSSSYFMLFCITNMLKTTGRKSNNRNRKNLGFLEDRFTKLQKDVQACSQSYCGMFVTSFSISVRPHLLAALALREMKELHVMITRANFESEK